jgi:hypothetical protein
MIFALDILYKDLLAASLVIASLTTRFFIFAWEVTLSLLAMLIGAVKTTADLVAAIYTGLNRFSRNRNRSIRTAWPTPFLQTAQRTDISEDGIEEITENHVTNAR